MRIKVIERPPLEARHGIVEGLRLEVVEVDQPELPQGRSLAVRRKRRELRKRDGYWVIAPGSGERVKLFTREVEEIKPVGGTCCACGKSDPEETGCPEREDATHCVHWWEVEE